MTVEPEFIRNSGSGKRNLDFPAFEAFRFRSGIYPEYFIPAGIPFRAGNSGTCQPEPESGNTN
jgi:hypothetical protein